MTDNTNAKMLAMQKEHGPLLEVKDLAIDFTTDTGKPVHAFTVAALRGKLAAFHEALCAAGHLLPPHADTAATHAPLRELPDVAARIRAIWNAKDPDCRRT